MLEIIYNDGERVANSLDFSKLQNKKVLVTGASGLIGLHIISSLKALKEKYNIDVCCWVNSHVDKKFKDLFKSFTTIVADLTEPNKISDLYLEKKFDVIIHSAGYAQPQKFTGDKMNTIRLNTQTIDNLFSILKENGTFVFCSTSEIYSGLIKENIDETEIGSTTPEHPRACYIESKRCGETICHAYAEKGYDVKIARISLAYGPGTRINDSRVMHNVIQKGLQEKKIVLLDSGSSIRTYGYVSDIVEMLWNIALHGKSRVYNVAGISKVSIKELAELISKKIDCNLSIPNDDTSGLSGNPKLVNLSIEKYTNEFNKSLFVDIDEGLNKTIEWQKYIL